MVEQEDKSIINLFETDAVKYMLNVIMRNDYLILQETWVAS